MKTNRKSDMTGAKKNEVCFSSILLLFVVFVQFDRENAHTHRSDNKFLNKSSHYFYMWYLNTSTGTYDERNDENACKHRRPEKKNEERSEANQQYRAKNEANAFPWRKRTGTNEELQIIPCTCGTDEDEEEKKYTHTAFNRHIPNSCVCCRCLRE